MVYRMLAVCLSAGMTASCITGAGEGASEVTIIQVASSMDEMMQPCLFIEAKGVGPRPLLVFLHTWSNGYDLDTQDWRDAAATQLAFLATAFPGDVNTGPRRAARPWPARMS